MKNEIHSDFWQKLPNIALKRVGEAYDFANKYPKEAALTATSVYLLYNVLKDFSSISAVDLYLILAINMPTIAVMEWTVPDSIKPYI